MKTEPKTKHELNLHGEHYEWEDLEDDVHRPAKQTFEDDEIDEG
jgi:hypothetical protein